MSDNTEDLDHRIWQVYQTIPTFSSNPEDHIAPLRKFVKAYADQELASLREQLKDTQDDFTKQGAEMFSLKVNYNSLCRLFEIEKEANEKIRKQLQQKEDENRELKFVLNNCKSYLEVFKHEWKEGEEMLHSEIYRLSAKLGKIWNSSS